MIKIQKFKTLKDRHKQARMQFIEGIENGVVNIEDMLISDESTIQACPNMGTKGSWGFEKPASIEGSKDQGWKIMYSACVD